MKFMRSKLGEKMKEEEYEEVRKGILKQEVMPSMRLLQFAGPAAERCNVCVYNCSYLGPKRLKDLAEIMYLSMSGVGLGFSVEEKYINELPVIKRQKENKIINKYVVEDSKEGWADCFYYCLEKWYNGEDVEVDYTRLRPAGARLKIMGGRSSGPRPLNNLIDFTRKKIIENQEKRLKPIDVHDIICKIGEIVVSGGIRRSALISLSDLKDNEMRDCKQGNFWTNNMQRCMANNSAVYNEKPTMMEFMEEWVALMKSGSGERGIFNRGGLKDVMPKRRKEVIGDRIWDLGTNPCVTDDTWIQTVKGPCQVKELIDKKEEVIVNGKKYKMESEGFFKTGRKIVFELETDNGYNLKLTEDHPLLVEDNNQYTWRQLKEVKIGDKILLSDHREYNNWEGNGNYEEGWLIGGIIGNDGIVKNVVKCVENFKELSVKYVGDILKIKNGTEYQILCEGLTILANKYNIKKEEDGLTIELKENIEKLSSEFYKGFIRGIFDLIGEIDENEIRLNVSTENKAKSIQRMMLRLGIVSKRENKEIKINGRNIELFNRIIGFNSELKMLKLEKLVTNQVKTDEMIKSKKLEYDNNYQDTVKTIIEKGEEDVYDVTVEEVHEFCANGIRVHNCGEILLQSSEFCNLSEIICRENDTEESLLRKMRIATILGTYQSTLTNYNYISEKWKKNQEDERLLGVSLTGQWDCPIVRNEEVLRKLRDYAIEINKEYAKRFNINESMSITCIKPSGTVSQVTNSSSGLHARFSQYYIRRVRISAKDPLFEMLKEQGVPYNPEVGQNEDNATTYVLEFPIKSPENSMIAKNLSAIEQLEYWKMTKLNYTEHNPSCTIYIKNDEWLKVGQWLWDNWEYITGLSFLPYSDHVYQLAPYEEITKEKYEELLSKMPKLNFSKLVYYEKEDTTDVKKEVACTGEKCEL